MRVCHEYCINMKYKVINTSIKFYLIPYLYEKLLSVTVKKRPNLDISVLQSFLSNWLTSNEGEKQTINQYKMCPLYARASSLLH